MDLIRFSVIAVAMAIISTDASAVLFDANDRSSNITQAGWTAVDLTGANGVTFTAVGGSVLDDRDRGTGNTNGAGGDVANNDMWRDFVFADDRPEGSVAGVDGMDITVTGLMANRLYDVRLWAFDDSSNHSPSMTWNGNALGFPSVPDPTSLDDYVVAFQASTDGAGTLLLEGRVAGQGGNCCNVFVNGFEVTKSVPEPATAMLGVFGVAMLGLRRRRMA